MPGRRAGCLPSQSLWRNVAQVFSVENVFSEGHDQYLKSATGHWMEFREPIDLKRFGRGEWIRTTGLLVPNQALYQAEPRPDKELARLGLTRNQYTIPQRRHGTIGFDGPEPNAAGPARCS